MEALLEEDRAGPLHDLPLLHLGELAVGGPAGQVVLGYPLLHLVEVALCAVHGVLALVRCYLATAPPLVWPVPLRAPTSLVR